MVVVRGGRDDALTTGIKGLLPVKTGRRIGFVTRSRIDGGRSSFCGNPMRKNDPKNAIDRLLRAMERN